MPKGLDEPQAATVAQAADLLYTTRQMRLKIQKDVDALAAREAELKTYIIENLPKQDAIGISGSIARVTLGTKTKSVVEDWEKVYDYVVENEAWELLQKRINDAAVKDRWEAGEEIPGVGRFQSIEVSCVKV